MSYVIKRGDKYLSQIWWLEGDHRFSLHQKDAILFDSRANARKVKGENLRVVRLVPKAKYKVMVTGGGYFFAGDSSLQGKDGDVMPKSLARAVVKFWGGKVVKVG